MSEFEKELVKWCVKYVHDLCTDDNGTLGMVTEQMDCTEYELFSGFEFVSKELGFTLEEE